MSLMIFMIIFFWFMIWLDYHYPDSFAWALQIIFFLLFSLPTILFLLLFRFPLNFLHILLFPKPISHNFIFKFFTVFATILTVWIFFDKLHYLIETKSWKLILMNYQLVCLKLNTMLNLYVWIQLVREQCVLRVCQFSQLCE